MKVRLYTILAFVWFATLPRANGQLYLGLSADFGNQVKYSSGQSFFKKAPSLGGNIFLQSREDFRSRWFLQYGISAGILGYRVVYLIADTLSEFQGEYDRDPNYYTVYASGYLQIGKYLKLGDTELQVAAGLGVTHYLDNFGSGTQFSSWTYYKSGIEPVFQYSTDLTKKSITAFGHFSVSLP